MKLFTAIAAASVIGTSFIAANPAEARNGWIQVAPKMYAKQIDTTGTIRTFQWRTREDASNAVTNVAKANCEEWSYRILLRDPIWIEALPGTAGYEMLNVACR